MKFNGQLYTLLGISLFSVSVLTNFPYETVKAEQIDTETNNENSSVIQNKISDESESNSEVTQENSKNDNQVSANQSSANKTTPDEETVKSSNVDNASEHVSDNGATKAPVVNNGTQVANKNAEDNVSFDDDAIGNQVKSNLGISSTDNITMDSIKNYSGNSKFAINVNDGTHQVTSLKGMENLQYLPQRVLIDFSAQVNDENNLDLTPLEKLNFNRLELQGNFSKTDLSTLKNIDPANIYQIGLYGRTTNNVNVNGMTNSQLNELSPWLIKFGDNNETGKQLNVSYNQLSDFSSLKSIEKKLWIYSVQNLVIDKTPLDVVIGKPLEFESAPNEVTGLQGEDLSDLYEIYLGNDDGKTGVYRKPIVNLGDHKYSISRFDNALNNYFIYGWGGFFGSNSDSYLYKYYDAQNGKSVLQYSSWIYRPVRYLSNPAITLSYVDKDGNQIKNGQTAIGYKIGDAYDLTNLSNISGYELSSDKSKLKGTYAAGVKLILLEYKKKKPVNNSRSSNYSDVYRSVFVKKNQLVSTYPDQAPVMIYKLDGTGIVNKVLGPATDWFSDGETTINGLKYYHIARDEWVRASEVYPYESRHGYVRTYKDSNKGLIDSHDEKVINKQLKAATDWYFDGLVNFEGTDYYRVATNEFVAVKDAFKYIPENRNIKTNKITRLFDETGNLIANRALQADSYWESDRSAIINGEKMLRVSTNEWVKDSDIENI